MHFNPRTPRGVRPLASRLDSAGCVISIHAPREGCDAFAVTVDSLQTISIHAPREGCDPAPQSGAGDVVKISIHAPREGCDPAPEHQRQGAIYFNPRTPRGVRLCATLCKYAQARFQSTHPARGATIGSRTKISANNISIHAPREGCDVRCHDAAQGGGDFNPRTPRGVRLFPSQCGVISR